MMEFKHVWQPVKGEGEGESMTLRTINIELKVDFDDDDKHGLLVEGAKQAAQVMYATAILLADKRKPRLTIHTQDYYSGITEVPFVYEEETL